MKKQLLKISASVVLLALCGMTFGQFVKPIKTLVIPGAGTMTIDGAATAAEKYCAAEATTVVDIPAGEVDNPADLSGSFQTCYDLKFLYVFASIKDDIAGNWDPKLGLDASWNYDNAEIFFDLDTNGTSATAYDSTCVQLRLARGTDTIFTGGAYNMHPSQRTDPLRAGKGNSVMVSGTDNWKFECKIPWGAICSPLDALGKNMDKYFVIGKGMQHAMDFAIGDNDKVPTGPGRDRQSTWDWEEDATGKKVMGTNYKTRNELGLVTFAKLISSVNYTTSGNSVVYPNPTTGLVTINNLDGATTVQVMNIAGQLVLTADVTNTNTVDMSQLENGIYFAVVNANVIKISLVK
jgi:hypothetical protein